METHTILNFNTSHVFINQSNHWNLRLGRIISIHLMFLLIIWLQRSWGSKIAISIHLMFLLIPRLFLRLRSRHAYFNTSHVSINQLSVVQQTLSKSHFNTSHVSINLLLLSVTRKSLNNFNTSHVSINRRL